MVPSAHQSLPSSKVSATYRAIGGQFRLRRSKVMPANPNPSTVAVAGSGTSVTVNALRYPNPPVFTEYSIVITPPAVGLIPLMVRIVLLL
jgi:hypothetical protein